MKKNILLILILLISIIIPIIISIIIPIIFNEGFENNILYTAIIVEPRKHRALRYVLNNFCSNLSNEWQFIIFHGNLNKEFVQEIIDEDLQNYKHKIKLINLNVDNLEISDYNKLFKSLEFYDNIPTEIFLVFQTDTIICSNNKEKINDFLEYDYIGAPFKWLNDHIGNGGLSLRKKSKMIEIIKNKPSGDENEDVYFSFYDDLKLPKDGKPFSVESSFYDSPFGIHKAWVFLNDEEYNKLSINCTECNELRKLNL
jgi:hypothetical protein